MKIPVFSCSPTRRSARHFVFLQNHGRELHIRLDLQRTASAQNSRSDERRLLRELSSLLTSKSLSALETLRVSRHHATTEAFVHVLRVLPELPPFKSIHIGSFPWFSSQDARVTPQEANEAFHNGILASASTLTSLSLPMHRECCALFPQLPHLRELNLCLSKLNSHPVGPADSPFLTHLLKVPIVRATLRDYWCHTAAEVWTHLRLKLDRGQTFSVSYVMNLLQGCTSLRHLEGTIDATESANFSFLQQLQSSDLTILTTTSVLPQLLQSFPAHLSFNLSLKPTHRKNQGFPALFTASPLSSDLAYRALLQCASLQHLRLSVRVFTDELDSADAKALHDVLSHAVSPTSVPVGALTLDLERTHRRRGGVGGPIPQLSFHPFFHRLVSQVQQYRGVLPLRELALERGLEEESFQAVVRLLTLPQLRQLRVLGVRLTPSQCARLVPVLLGHLAACLEKLEIEITPPDDDEDMEEKTVFDSMSDFVTGAPHLTHLALIGLRWGRRCEVDFGDVERFQTAVSQSASLRVFRFHPPESWRQAQITALVEAASSHTYVDVTSRGGSLDEFRLRSAQRERPALEKAIETAVEVRDVALMIAEYVLGDCDEPLQTDHPLACEEPVRCS